jgi:hypothetical protein
MESDGPVGGRRKWARLLGLAAAAAIATATLLLVPDFAALALSSYKRFVPRLLRDLLPPALALGVAAFLQRRPDRAFGLAIPARLWDRLDDLADRSLVRPLATALALICGAWLAGWVPHYLTWPLWADHDQFAVSAQAWDAGKLPYRDLPDFDFPAPIYQFWLAGKVFGWGHPAPFLAADVALICLLGGSLVAWSRGRLGGPSPGLAGFLCFLAYYLSLDYSQTAQRDWHSSVCVVLGLLALEAWPGRAARFFSAAMLGTAIAFRPQAVLFAPALASALFEDHAGTARSWGATKRLLGWSAACGVAVLMAFGPLIAAGVLDDFVRSLRVANYGGSYNRVTPESFFDSLGSGLSHLPTALALFATVVVAAMACDRSRAARTWALAMVAAVIYKPLSPIQHRYLEQPVILVGAVSIAFLVGCLLTAPRVRPASKTFLVVVILAIGLPWSMPAYVRPLHCLRLIATLAHAEGPPGGPPGCDRSLLPNGRGVARYSWEDYRGVLDHLRRTTTERTPVANLLRHHPYPSINGMVGRPSPFPAAGGILWIHWIAPDDEDRFVESLERSDSCVAVWVPKEEGIGETLRLERLEGTIRRLFRPEARFGRIEVWRRVPDVGRTAEGPHRWDGCHSRTADSRSIPGPRTIGHPLDLVGATACRSESCGRSP